MNLTTANLVSFDGCSKIVLVALQIIVENGAAGISS
jgi:hypothetical protein